MATAGERYDVRTGNIWLYAHRGDMTGLKAAAKRGVDVNLTNTVGWTACHAAAAGGQTKALRYLIQKMNADALTITDNGGNLPIHHAAKNGHVHALRFLQESGADLTKVRFSQAKGKAVHDMVVQAYRKAGRNNEAGDDDDEKQPVGYARKQSKSTAMWGPRRTPISCKIKKKIMKDKRKNRKEKSTVVAQVVNVVTSSSSSNSNNDRNIELLTCTPPIINNNSELADTMTTIKINDLKVDDTMDVINEIIKDDFEKEDHHGSLYYDEGEEEEPSYLETIQQIKRNKKQQRLQRQQQNSLLRETTVIHEEAQNLEIKYKNNKSSNFDEESGKKLKVGSKLDNRMITMEYIESINNSSSSSDDESDDDDNTCMNAATGQFAALALLRDGSDSDSDSDSD